MSLNTKPIYKRILLKISGEALQGSEKDRIETDILSYIAKEIKKLIKIGIQIGIVIGGGNLFRGSELSKSGIDDVIGDYIGMLSTVINGLAMFDALCRVHVKTHLMSAISLNGICDKYNRFKAIKLLRNNQVVIFSAGTGNPFFTTDFTACLRGIEIKADVILKATKVDGVFNADPNRNPFCTMYNQLSYKEVVEKELKIMDLSSFILARDHQIPIRVFNINKPGSLLRVVTGKQEGTLIFG